MATTASTTSVQKLYIAYFGRPADAAGLAFYADALDAGTTTVSAIATSFGASTEAATTVALSTSAYVSAVYLQAFGRAYASSTDGTFWTDAITAGTTTKELAMVQILNGASGTDATAVTNKVAVANTYTTAVTTDGKSYAGATAITAAKLVMSGVTSVAATVTSGNTAAAAAVVNLDAVSGGTGSSFLLTSSVDTGAAMTGGAGDDTFTADNTGAAVVTSVADTLTGGAGIDTLNVYSTGATFGAPTLVSIETLNIFDQDDTFDASVLNFGSVNAINLTRGVGGLTLTVGTNVTKIGMTDIVQANSATVLAFGATVTSMILNLNGVTGAQDIDINGTLLTTHNVTASGIASSFNVLDFGAGTTDNITANVKLTTTLIATSASSGGVLTLSGAGAIVVGILDVGYDTVTATAHTGGLTAIIGATVDTVINLGSGADVITASTENTLVATDKLQVDAGAGQDTLILAAAADISTVAEGSHYTNFEVMRLADDFSLLNLASITHFEQTAATSKTLSNLTAVAAGNITVLATQTTSHIYTLADSTGSADVISIKATSATAATGVNMVGLDVVGFETVNIHNGSFTNGTDVTTEFLNDKSDAVTAVNYTGGADTLLNISANTLDVVAVAIDASGITGTGSFEVTMTDNILAGSSITGSLGADQIGISTVEGSTYRGGAGNDAFTLVTASLVQTGNLDNIIDGGAGTDTLTMAGATLTLTDNHFIGIQNMEILNNTGIQAHTIEVGTAFNLAFSDGFTHTTGALTHSQNAVLNYNFGIATVDLTLNIMGGAVDGAVAAEDMTLVTGSGADTIVFNAGVFVGLTGAGASIDVDTGAGADNLDFNGPTTVAQTTNQAIVINMGTGADIVDMVHTSADTDDSTVLYTIDAGDSLATGRDKITGFDVATADIFSDVLIFTGTTVVGTLGTSVNFGTIKSHAISNGVATFDDIETHTTALIANAANLADIVGYIDANTADLDTVAFKFDSTGDGAVDATMVYNNNTTGSLVELAGTTSIVKLLITTAASTVNNLFIS